MRLLTHRTLDAASRTFCTAGNSKLVFSATDPHAVDFLWTFPNSSVQTGQQATYLFPDDNNAKYQVCLNVADRYGCQDTFCDSVPIVLPPIQLPRAAAPSDKRIMLKSRNTLDRS